ncbi:MAG: hypothetical protein COB02_18185 [Candidatus Cloacimonadota bacterium]|nr:MAG: hypothetical protein COB02_18185 [Candidatus Cloacimonadota bacterium]
MIQDILRIIKKGKNDTIVNLKIREFHKEDFDRKNSNILLKYKENNSSLLEYTDIHSDSLDQEKELSQVEFDELQILKTDLENKNSWLLEISENGYIELPVFNISDEEVQSYRKLNAIIFRANDYAPMGEQMAMQYDDKINDTTTWISHILDVKVRWPKN